MFINELDDIFNEYNKTYSTIKMKPLDVMSSTYIDSGVETNNKDPNFKVDKYVRRSKDKIIFAKGYNEN